MAPPNKPCVVDIFYGDNGEDGRRPIQWEQTIASGIVGCIHKATEGTGFTDKLYAARRKQAGAAGLKWGAYHFFHGSNPVAEADHFLAVAEPDKDTLVALDWENLPHGGAPNADQARAFLDRVQEKLNRKAVIYSGNVAKEQLRGVNSYFGAHRLWLCQYGQKFTVQASWSLPWLWQNNGDSYGPGPHQIAGIRGLCDNNTVVTGTVDELLAQWAA